jgi:aspartate aminotransferase
MSNPLSDRINNLATSQTLAMGFGKRAKTRQRHHQFKLGEPDFNTPDFIKEAQKRDR